MPPSIWLYLHDFPARANPLIGGMSKAIHGLAAGLAANGASVTVLCGGETAGTFETPAGYVVRCFANRGRACRFFTLPVGLAEYVRTAPRPDSVIINGIFHPSVPLLARVLRGARVPYIVAPHDPYHPSIFAHGVIKKAIYWRLIEKPALDRAQAVQVLDMRHRAFLRDLHVNTPAVEVQNGFTEAEVPGFETLAWRTDGPIRLLFLGRLDQHNKSLDLLIDAVSLLKHRHDLHLTLQGPDWGDRRALQERIRQNGVEDRVTMRNPDYQRSSTQIMVGHDVLCLPSRFEGFGLSALEAMTAARVLVVSDIAGIAKHVRASGSGVIVKPNRTALVAELDRLIQRREQWRAMGLAGRAYALEHMTWAAIGATALQQYTAAAAKGCDPSARVTRAVPVHA